MFVIFAGAGASKAVNPAEYPTTVEFFNKIPIEVREDKLFALIVEYLQNQRRHIATIDIEHVLWALAELRTFLKQATDGSGVPGWFLRGRLLQPLSQTSDFGNIIKGGSNVLRLLDELIGRLNQLVYEWYSREPQAEELEQTWLPMLRALRDRGDRVELATTNYDIVLEAALAAMGGESFVETGRRGSVQPHLDVQVWRDASAHLSDRKSQGLLTKLHGSVDWSRGAERIFVGDPTYKGSHERHVIIYPGFKGVPDAEPFATFHNYFEQIAARATHFLFIGFAFRDEYINDVLRRSATRARATIINPADLPSSLIPFPPDQYEHVRKPFDLETAEEVLSMIAPAAPN